jgi:dihydrofolate synthase/folylpolyglutamate synthase
MLELDTAFNFPHKSYKTIHVAGTNGKGSVTTKIASALTQLGFKTGLYTSPHIDTFHERIQINGEMISNEDASFFLNKILEISKEITFFEALTMLAFLYFQKKQVDFAVIETGLGGTLDATNVILPELSVITSISYDHMNILGNSLNEIAENKAGIIKQNTGVVVGYRAALEPVLRKAFEEKAPLYILPPKSDWVEENTEIAKKVVSLLFPMAKPLDYTILPPCRFEILENDGLTYIFDIAHNQDGLEKLFERVHKFYPDQKVFVIFGTCKDKSIDFAIPFLKKHAEEIFPFDIENPRIMRRSDLAAIIGSNWENLELFTALARKENGIVLITGSAYIMAEAKERLFSKNHQMV